MQNAYYFDDFFRSYLECAVWSSLDWDNMVNDNPEPMDKRYSVDDFEKRTLKILKAECVKFWEDHPEIHSDASQAGHDFWLTRNGHGAGFWDGDWEEELGRKLTEDCNKYGEVNLYIYRRKIRV